MMLTIYRLMPTNICLFVDSPQNASIVWFPMNIPDSVRLLIDSKRLLRKLTPKQI